MYVKLLFHWKVISSVSHVLSCILITPGHQFNATIWLPFGIGCNLKEKKITFLHNHYGNSLLKNWCFKSYMEKVWYEVSIKRPSQLPVTSQDANKGNMFTFLNRKSSLYRLTLIACFNCWTFSKSTFLQVFTRQIVAIIFMKWPLTVVSNISSFDRKNSFFWLTVLETF